jgi:hypothetical protein
MPDDESKTTAEQLINDWLRRCERVAAKGGDRPVREWLRAGGALDERPVTADRVH